jgi:hypothetical protein
MDTPKPDPNKVLPNTPEFDRFADLTRKLFAVPKAEVEALEAEYQATKPKRVKATEHKAA